MSIFLVLDILLIVLILLFTPIGYWRGPIKELYVSLGILFGILLADFWARPWGHDLSTTTSLTAGSGAFIVAMSFLIASTFILGYGLGATLAPAWFSQQARALGACVAGLNGILLLSFSLQYVRLYLLSDANEKSLYDSHVAKFLLNEIGWVLMAAALIAVPLLLFILITGRRAYEPTYEEVIDEYPEPVAVAVAAAPRRRVADPQAAVLPPRVPASPQARAAEQTAYKADPTQPRRSPTAETRPIAVAEARLTAEPSQPTDAEAASARMGDTDPHLVLPGSAPEPETVDTVPEVTPLIVDPEPPASDLPSGYGRCANCHAVLAPEVTICPNCGTLR